MNKLPTTFALLLLLVLGGCLETDGQDVYLRYDEENDRIDAMFIYRGLFAEGGADGQDPIPSCIKDLTDAMETGEFMFWNNWPLKCDPSRSYDAPRNALLKHIEVENGGLFTGPDGVLCGYQFIRVNKAKSFIKKVNTLIELGLQAATLAPIARLDNHKLDADTKDNIREFLRGRNKVLTLEKGRIEVKLPLSKKDHAWMKKAIEDHFMDNMPGEITQRAIVEKRRKDGVSNTDTSSGDAVVNIEGSEIRKEVSRAPSYRFFWDNEISFVRSEDLTTIGIGVAGDDELHITKARDGLYHKAMLEELRKDKERFQIEDGLPQQEFERRFADFRTREAKLPKKLAAKRAK